MNRLLELRDEIDTIDRQIYDLFAKRLDISCEVAEYKIQNNLNVFDPAREEQKLEDIAVRSDDAFLSQGMVELFSQIMSISKKKQYRMLAEAGRVRQNDFICVDEFDFSDATVVYQGVEGAYSQKAALTFFRKMNYAYHVETWRDAMEALTSGHADYAVLPIENSTAGSVVENYDLMVEYDVAIIGEQIIEIDHALLGLPEAKLSDIKTVYSHPQALMQCDGFLRTRPDWEAISLENTAVSAKKIREDGDISQAAIAGEINAKLYGLSVIRRAIQDESNNKTRFIIVTNKHIFRRNADTITLCFELPDEKGSLYQSLSHFIFNGLNMTRIESRPIRDKQWQYRFFVDFLGNLRDDAVINALRGLDEETTGLRVLGNY
ncbi:MAG: prephenate dehydratase [Lachnospiraceae bacterium]|nr:prephenate dehydratase [Lachnospiraceae bacterium]